MNTVKRVDCFCIRKQLFRRRLSKKVHATIPKGIVGGFEFTVQRNLKEWHERPLTYVRECESRATKVGSTATDVRNIVLIISHITLSRAHFFPTTFSKSCIRPFNRPLVLYLRGLFWCLLDLSRMSFLREGKTGFKKACLSIYVLSERAFIYGSGVCKFGRYVCKIFPRANWPSFCSEQKIYFC